MFNKIKQTISSNITNAYGFTTKRKLIIIESDDWGSILMPSLSTLNSLSDKGCNVSHPYYKYDSLASSEDLYKLFEVLTSVKDSNGNHAVITADTIVANPDFDKIKESDFSTYYYEPFTETLKRYKNCENSFDLWKQGMDSKIWRPQFHGREHLNICQWMKALKHNDKITRLAFEYNMFGIGEDSGIKIPGGTYMRAFNEGDSFNLESHNEIISTGLNLFQEIFGYKSESFIAPAYTWNTAIEKTLASKGVKYLQGTFKQSCPIGNQKYKNKYHFIGQRNNNNQYYLMRNAFFEPSQNSDYDWINDCLKRINIAFFWNKPATISVHRINFIGAIDSRNRDRNLPLFKQLLKEIIKRWPEVEFISTDQLGKLIESKNEQK